MDCRLVFCEKYNGLWNMAAWIDGEIRQVQACDKYDGLWALAASLYPSPRERAGIRTFRHGQLSKRGMTNRLVE